MLYSYGKLRVAPRPKADPIDHDTDIRADDGYVSRESSDCAQEIPKEDEDAPQLDEESYQGPPEEDERNSREEGGGAFRLLFPCEEEQGLCRSDDDREADEEQDLEIPC